MGPLGLFCRCRGRGRGRVARGTPCDRSARALGFWGPEPGSARGPTASVQLLCPTSIAFARRGPSAQQRTRE
eukprot:12376314-Alexandrium_andersonii.AAC.1